MVAKAALDTPPSSDIEPDHRLPPSPPASPAQNTPISIVDVVVRVIQLRKAGRVIPGDWHSFSLSPTQYAELNSLLDQDEALKGYYEDKIRYDYDPFAQEYTLRMPSRVHEEFITAVEDAITKAIAELADSQQDEKVKKALNEVRALRSVTVELHAPTLDNSSQESRQSEDEVVVRRSPDGSFYHPQQPALPTMVFEVSYSQQQRDLPRLAESYIIDSQHQIRCVVGLDIPYAGKAKDATVSVWRPGSFKDDSDEEIGICTLDTEYAFRHANGTTNTGDLTLYLTDLLPPAILSTLPPTAAEESIRISFASLSSFLNDAEKSAAAATRSTAAPTSAPKRFRKRKRTPSEELSDPREEMYSRREAAELEKERKVDGEWRARSRRRISRDGPQLAEVEVVERRRSTKRRTTARQAGAGDG